MVGGQRGKRRAGREEERRGGNGREGCGGDDGWEGRMRGGREGQSDSQRDMDGDMNVPMIIHVVFLRRNILGPLPSYHAG